MTRKDYVAIGDALRVTHETICRDQIKRGRPVSAEAILNGHYDRMITALADVFEANNPQFNRDKFVKYVNGLDCAA